MNPRVWFKSISLENVRSFGTKQTINFTDKDGNAARWNVILGDNGTGKTTVLKGLCLVISDKFNAPIIRVELDSFSRSIDGPNISCLLFNFNSKHPYTANFVGMVINWFGKSSLLPATSYNDEPVNEHKVDEVAPLLFAYGAARRISTSAITRENENQLISLFDENYDLVNAEEWLVQADYLRLKDKTYEKRFNTVYTVIEKLFRDEAPGGIMFDTNSGTPQVKLCTHYGAVRFHELSLGYKTLIAWMVDFAKGLFDRYPDSEDPLAEPAVCLVDEIDLHLHPKFQRTIIKFLTDTFPNTQFIVTAHSPLIVVAAEERPLDANIILLKREGDQTVVVNDSVDVSKWSVDQILNSDLFGYVPPRSEPLIELRTERDTLLAKPKLTKKDQARLIELDNKIGFVPFGNDQAEIKAETIIQQLADVLRSKQGV